MLSKRITITGFPKATVERLEQLIADKVHPQRYKIAAAPGGGWHLLAMTGRTRIALNGKAPCRTVRELGDLVAELHCDGVLDADAVAELFEQLEVLAKRKP